MSWLYRGTETITPQIAGWKYCGMKMMDLAKQNKYEITFTDYEGILLSLSAENVTVIVDGQEFKIIGRTGVFAEIGRAHV